MLPAHDLAEPDPSGEQRELVARLRAVIEAKGAELAVLRAGLAAVLADLETERELRRRLDLRVAELERQNLRVVDAWSFGRWRLLAPALWARFARGGTAVFKQPPGDHAASTCRRSPDAVVARPWEKGTARDRR